MALFTAISLLLADALAETHAAGAPSRWWLTAIVVIHALAVTASWRRTTWTERTRLSIVTVATALAVTAWLPEGLSNGIRLATLSTSTVLCLSAGAACVWAALTAARVRRWPLPVAAVMLALGAYAALAFGLAALRGEPFHSLLADGSFWRALPHVVQGAVVGAVVVLPLGLLAAIVGMGLRWPDPRTRAAQAYRAVTIALLGAMVLPGIAPRGAPDTQVAAAVGDKPSPLTPQQRLAALDIGLKSLEDADREALRDRWDPAYLAGRFNPDPQGIYDWVRQNTIWVPYRGVLRGPAGVLMDRLGNSLDRSLLLADLLKRTGRTVRLARGELSRDAALTQLARRLTETAAAADQEEQAAGDLASDISDLSREYQVDPAAVTGSLLQPAEALASAFVELDRRSSEQTARLLAAVPRPDVPAEWTARFESALRAIQDHWWVQVHEGDQWLDLDLFHDHARFGTAVAAAAETLELENVPADLHHDVVIRVVTARQRPGSTTRRQVLEHTLRPLDVLGQPVTVQFLPTRWPPQTPETPAALRAAFLQQEDWAAAVAVGDKVVIEAAFDVRGDRQSTSGGFGALGSGAASVFGQAQQPTQLTGTWLEFELRRPGEAPRTVRREVFDFTDGGGAPLGEEARLARSLALMGRTEILAFGWEFAPDYVSHLAIRSLVENRPTLEAAAAAADPARMSADTVPPRVAPPVSPLFMVALARFEWSRVGRFVFNDRINVIARHTVLVAEGAGISARSVTDIVANEVGVALDAPDGFAVRLEQGVTDTNAEALLGFGKPLAGNTADAYANAAGWTTLKSTGDAESIQLEASAKRHLTADLEAGRLIVAPRTPLSGAAGTFTGWWRVDPATGDTLGIAGNGRGQAVTLLVALQVSGETSVHYNVMTEMAKGFIFEEAFCRAAPYAFVASRPIWMFYINSLAPEWWIRTLPPAAPDVPTAVEAGRNMCIFGLMAGGVLATLPLVMMTLRFATLGHIAVDGAVNLRRAGRPGRWGRGPARQRGNGAGAPGSSSAPAPSGQRGGGGRGPGPERECPGGGGGDWGRGRTDDGFGNYPPNSPPRPGETAHVPGPGWTSRDPAEVDALVENAKRVQGEAQNAFDEALARYREAARQVDATSGEPAISKERNDALLAEQQAEAGLHNARADLWRSKQRVAHWEEVKPAAERVRATERTVEEALGRAPASGADDAWLEEYSAAARQAGAARDEYLRISSKKLSDYPGSATPSGAPGGGTPGGGAAPGGAVPGGPPAPGPSGTMPIGGCGGSGAGPGGAAGASGGSSGSGAAGSAGASSGGVDPFGATQQDLGKTMPGAPPATSPQPTTSTAPIPGGPGVSQTSGRAVLGMGVIVGGTGG